MSASAASPAPRSGFLRASEWVVLLLALVVSAFQLHPILENERVPFVLLVPIFALFSLLHAMHVMGAKRALAFFAIAAAISLFAETIGTMTGIVFGNYYYTDALGPKLFGEVPIVIPLAWFQMLYPCYLMTNLTLGGRPLAMPKRFGDLFRFSLYGALIMTAWDLTLDPYMVGFDKAWVWEDGGPYFGIPIHNYVGWVGTVFVVFWVFRSVQPRIPGPKRASTSRLFLALPLATYAFMSLGDIILGHPEETVVISPFVMGMPFLFAVTALAQWKPKG